MTSLRKLIANFRFDLDVFDEEPSTEGYSCSDDEDENNEEEYECTDSKAALSEEDCMKLTATDLKTSKGDYHF